jgi:hypothetical protein
MNADICITCCTLALCSPQRLLAICTFGRYRRPTPTVYRTLGVLRRHFGQVHDRLHFGPHEHFSRASHTQLFSPFLGFGQVPSMAARSKLALQQVVGFLVMWKGSVPRRGLLSGLFASLRDRPLLLSCSHFVCMSLVTSRCWAPTLVIGPLPAMPTRTRFLLVSHLKWLQHC